MKITSFQLAVLRNTDCAGCCLGGFLSTCTSVAQLTWNMLIFFIGIIYWYLFSWQIFYLYILH